VKKFLTTGPYSDQMHSLHTFLPYFCKIHSSITLPSTSRSSEWSFPFRSSNQNIVRISHPSSTYYMLHLSHPPWFDQVYKLWSSLLCSLLHPSNTSYFFSPDILLSTLYLNTLSVLHLLWETKFHTHTVLQVKLYFFIYERRLKSSWNHLFTVSWNFMEVWWWSLFWSTSLSKQCTSYNAPPTFQIHAADHWLLQNFLPQSSLFTVGKD
jgi:hypothetical protein